MNRQVTRALAYSLFILLTLVLTACDRLPFGAAPNQSPSEYLNGALDWIQTHGVMASKSDWATIRREALALAPAPKTTADTYPAIRLALKRLNDENAWFAVPNVNQAVGYPGLMTRYPENIIYRVDSGSPADKAGLRVGDVIQEIDGQPPHPFDPEQVFPPPGSKSHYKYLRPGQSQPSEAILDLVDAPNPFRLTPTGRRLAVGTNGGGYLELPMDFGDDPASGRYPGQIQKLMREMDQAGVCGWVIDLRRNSGGDIWTYLAALSPLLGEGKLGGFAYADGKQDSWGLQKGKVMWNDVPRDESAVDGGIYTLKQPNAPVVLLTSSNTTAAGELAVIAFRGRPGVHIVGEPTHGLATLIDHTPLADSANIYLSGAYATDRTGQKYDASIQPDQVVKTDWTRFGMDDDPVLANARDWLVTQPGCKP